MSDGITIQHGAAKGATWVQGACPTCGSRSLFIGSGGYVTCANLHCSDPCAPSKALGITFPDRSA